VLVALCGASVVFDEVNTLLFVDEAVSPSLPELFVP
jgi:hypothetical protein